MPMMTGTILSGVAMDLTRASSKPDFVPDANRMTVFTMIRANTPRTINAIMMMRTAMVISP